MCPSVAVLVSKPAFARNPSITRKTRSSLSTINTRCCRCSSICSSSSAVFAPNCSGERLIHLSQCIGAAKPLNADFLEDYASDFSDLQTELRAVLRWESGGIGFFSSPPGAFCLCGYSSSRPGCSTSAEEPIHLNVYPPPALWRYQQASPCRQRYGSCCGR